MIGVEVGRGSGKERVATALNPAGAVGVGTGRERESAEIIDGAAPAERAIATLAVAAETPGSKREIANAVAAGRGVTSDRAAGPRETKSPRSGATPRLQRATMALVAG